MCLAHEDTCYNLNMWSDCVVFAWGHSSLLVAHQGLMTNRPKSNCRKNGDLSANQVHVMNHSFCFRRTDYQNVWGNVLEVQYNSFLGSSCIIELTHETPSGMVAWQNEHKWNSSWVWQENCQKPFHNGLIPHSSLQQFDISNNALQGNVLTLNTETMYLKLELTRLCCTGIYPK